MHWTFDLRKRRQCCRLSQLAPFRPLPSPLCTFLYRRQCSEDRSSPAYNHLLYGSTASTWDRRQAATMIHPTLIDSRNSSHHSHNPRMADFVLDISSPPFELESWRPHSNDM
eukprot:Gregarina_sp_Poly_1__4821@NODE_256_length_10541_cov_633_466679_g223_i0_p15_GENE_NODE_256_length_10541_cov_633_466679_g223_i0NODE_256_length_10541_cov_633_466679_g223_i0_p15_ORF_typecomplete_len112_score1_89DUF4567/PF15131_6/0_14_NODE_256_length_10541_cov_633_466679_g223_i054035738